MAVHLKNISKRYTASPKPVLDNISLDIEDGEFVVLLGPSGCGKSTLLRIIAGLETLSSGEVWIDDRCVNTISPKDRDVAMVFQNYALYPHMSVFENMAFGLKMRKMPKAQIQSRVEDVAESLALTDYLQRKPKELSGGQRQRVALGRAIVRQPKAFLMDEPLSNLDARLRSQTRLELEKLHQDLKTTTVYVTHDQVEAMTLGERVVVLHQGIIQQVGKPTDVYQHPSNTFVGQFMGHMSLLPATFKHKEKHLILETGEKWPVPTQVATQLARHNDDIHLMLGIRPEHFIPWSHLACEAASTSHDSFQKISFQPKLTESLGKELMLYGDVANTSIAVELPADFEVSGGDVELGLHLERISYFDAKSTQNLIP